MKRTILALALLAACSAVRAEPPYTFTMTLVSEDSRPAPQRNLCGYASGTGGGTYIVVIPAKFTDKACHKGIVWTESGTQSSSAVTCVYDMEGDLTGYQALVGYADKRVNSCFSRVNVDWK